jgi:O-antigen ligase
MVPLRSNGTSEAPGLSRSGIPAGLEHSSGVLGRRVVYWLLAAGLSAVAGFALTLVELPLLVGAIVASLMVFLVARNPYLGLLAYVLVFTLRLGEIFPALAPLRLERLVGLMTFGFLILRQVRRTGGITLDGSRQTIQFYLLILAAFLTVPLAVWRGGAWGGVVDFIKLLIFYLLVVHLVDTRAKLRGFVALHCLLVLYLAVDSTLNYLSGALLHAQGIDRALGSTSIASGPNELGATMAATVPLLAVFAFNRRGGTLRVLLILSVALMVFTLILTGSRSAFIGFVGTLGYFAWHSRHRVALGIAGALLLVGIFSAMPEQYRGRYSTITQSELDASSMERIKVWKKGIHMILDRPLTGVGVHCFGTANAYFYSTGRRSWLESHSLYIQVPAEMGLIGAFAFFSFMFAFLRLNRRTAAQLEADEDPEAWSYERTLVNGMFAGYVALLFTGIFGHSMMRETWYVYAALGLATLRIYLAERPGIGASERAELMR